MSQANGLNGMAAKRTLMPSLLIAASLLGVSPVNAASCDRMRTALPAAQSSSFAASIASQMGSPSAKITRSYRLGNWYLFNVDTPISGDSLVFFRGDPATHRYAAAWNSGGGRNSQTQLRNWARTNIPGVPEALGKCFASLGARQ